MNSDNQVGLVATLPDEPVDYAELLTRCMGNNELAQRVLARFEQSFADGLVELQEAFDDQSGDRIANVAHRLKGASANVSAMKLSDLLSELEELGRLGLVEPMSKLVDQLQREWIRFKQRSPLERSTVTAAD
jgi:HPt (histidine-containing phosphotransfer) domain-containing protein